MSLNSNKGWKDWPGHRRLINAVHPVKKKSTATKERQWVFGREYDEGALLESLLRNHLDEIKFRYVHVVDMFEDHWGYVFEYTKDQLVKEIRLQLSDGDGQFVVEYIFKPSDSFMLSITVFETYHDMVFAKLKH